MVTRNFFFFSRLSTLSFFNHRGGFNTDFIYIYSYIANQNLDHFDLSRRNVNFPQLSGQRFWEYYVQENHSLEVMWEDVRTEINEECPIIEHCPEKPRQWVDTKYESLKGSGCVTTEFKVKKITFSGKETLKGVSLWV